MAIEFDGVDDYVDCGSDGSIDDIFDGGGSVAVWLNPDNFGESSVGVIAGQQNSGGTTGWSLMMRDTGGSFVECLTLEVAFSTTDPFWTSSNNSISAGSWVHVVLVYNDDSDANNPTFYIDGVAATTSENTAPSGTYDSGAAETVVIGNNGGTTRTFDGEAEDLRFFSSILTQEQVSQLVAGYRGPIGNEILWLSCDDFEGLAHPDGTTLTAGTHYLHDKSVNDNRGNPTNGVIARASDAPRYYGVL